MRNPLTLRRLAWPLLALAASTLAAGAQTNTAEISGVVRDSSGAVLPGAAVVATQAATGTVVERPTDVEGRFFLPGLRIGEWDLTVTMPGFAPQTRKGVVLEIGRTVALEFTLVVQGLEEQVIVQSVVPVLQTNSVKNATKLVLQALARMLIGV